MKDTCGECKFFRTEACFAKDPKPDDPKCQDFVRVLEHKREKSSLHKACGLSELGPFEAVYIDGKPVLLVRNGENYQIVESVTNEGKTILPKEVHEIPYEPYGYYEHAYPIEKICFGKSAMNSTFSLIPRVFSKTFSLLVCC